MDPTTLHALVVIAAAGFELVFLDRMFQLGRASVLNDDNAEITRMKISATHLIA